jgi:Cof subfamily protein (haloacid dehalogenase superfamily)
MVEYRALAIDLDGTLLTPAEVVSPRNQAAVRAALDHGLEVIVATARWYRMAQEVAAQFSLTGPAIACSGAQVRRLGDGGDLLDRRLPPAFVSALYEICDSMRCVATVALDDEVVVKLEGNPDPASMPAGLRQTTSLASTLPQVPRIALIQGSTVNQRIVDSLAPEWSDRVRFVESISSAAKTILTLTAVGADKGEALRAACDDLGLDPAQVVAIGDADNDIEMFRVAGASFAMGQASATVKAAATAVTANNEGDGVALAIEQVLAGNLS